MTIGLGPAQSVEPTQQVLDIYMPLESTLRIGTMLRLVVVTSIVLVVVGEDRLRDGHATDPRFKTLAPRYGRPDLWSFLAQASSWPSGLVPATVAGKPTCAETFVSGPRLVLYLIYVVDQS